MQVSAQLSMYGAGEKLVDPYPMTTASEVGKVGLGTRSERRQRYIYPDTSPKRDPAAAKAKRKAQRTARKKQRR